MNQSMPLEPLQPPQTKTQNSLPTVGAVLGSVLGSVVADRAHLDPVTGASVIAGATALVTAFFHWIGSKLGLPL